MREKDATFQARLPCANAIIWLAACGRNTDLHLWHAPSLEEIETDENRPPGGGQGSLISVVDDNNMVQRREE